MAKWNIPVITENGFKAIEESLKGNVITLDKIKLSDKEYTDNLENLETIADVKKEVSISSISKQDDKIVINAIVTNENEQNGFDLRTIGIYAGNILFAVVTCTRADFIPPDRKDGILTINFELVLHLDRKANFTINYNSNGLLRVKDVNNIINEKIGKIVNIDEIKEWLSSKLDKKDGVTSVVLDGNTIKVTKNGVVSEIELPRNVVNATETTSGTVTLKQIKDIVKEFGYDTEIQMLKSVTRGNGERIDILVKDFAKLPKDVASIEDLEKYKKDLFNQFAHKPNNMRKFIASSMSKSQIKLTWIPPKDSYNNGNLDVAVGGVMIRMGESDYPRSITEGTLVTKSTATSETSYVVDNLIENKTYYFSAFPYSTSNVYNTSNADSNHAKAKPIRARVYGITRNITDGSTKWTRTKGSVNMSATPTIGTNKGKSNFDSYYPWSEMKRVTVDGDTLVKIPKFWYKRTQDEYTETIEIADNKLDGYELHPGSGRYVGAYLCSSYNRSVSGGQITFNKTRSQMRDYIKQRGSQYSMYDIATDMAIKMLYLVEFAENNTQALVQTTNAVSKCPTGYSDELGDGSGISSKGVGAYRGIEGMLAGGDYQDEFIDGINIYKNNAYVCTEPNNYRDDTHDNYYNVNYILPNSGYISKHGCDPQKPWIMLPVESKGTENTYFTDYVNTSTSGWYIAYRHWHSDSSYGLFYLRLYYGSSSSYSDMSARLIRTL